VARLAGVSRQTVSRVLHESAQVAADTRARVLEVISELDYQPDPVARSLVRRRTYILGILISGFTGYTRDRILAGAEEEARERGFNLFIFGAESGPVGEPVHCSLIHAQRYEGLFILYRGARSDTLRIFDDIPARVPIATIGYAFDRPGVMLVKTDDHGGARLAAQHLLSLGHRRIVHIAGPAERIDVAERIDGYRAALRDSGIEPRPDWVLHGDWSPERSYELTLGLFRRGADFTAVTAQSDLMALGAIRAIKDSGRHVPGDVAVVGYDDIDIGRFVDPPLTTIHQPIYEMGRTGIRVLVERIEGRRGEGGSVRLSTQLVVRASAGPAGR
jgi:DNA-binding LacI/PurR family transcriptional regulator